MNVSIVMLENRTVLAYEHPRGFFRVLTDGIPKQGKTIYELEAAGILVHRVDLQPGDIVHEKSARYEYRWRVNSILTGADLRKAFPIFHDVEDDEDYALLRMVG